MTDLQEPFDQAVVAILNACPDADEEQAEDMLEAITFFVFSALKNYIEEQDESARSH